MKICSTCQQSKLAKPEFFHRLKSSADGYHSQCRECRHKKRSMPAELEKSRASGRRYYHEHAKELCARSTAYSRKNKNRIKARERTYNRAHPEKTMLAAARSRARKKGVPFSITVKDVLQAIPANNKCPITGMPFQNSYGRPNQNSMSLDRIIPSLGYVPGNITVISYLANTIKQGCTDPDVFIRIAEHLERFISVDPKIQCP